MNDSRRPFGAPQPEPIDDNQDRMGSMEELHFEEEETARIGDAMPENELEHLLPDSREAEAGLTGASTPDHHSTDDDLSPETLIHEDGARSPTEEGDDEPADLEVTIVDEDDIGGGYGLDEEEMAIVDPLDGRPDRP